MGNDTDVHDGITDQLKYELGVFDGVYSDMRAAKRFMLFTKGDIKFLNERSCFIYYDGKRWVPDRSEQVIAGYADRFVSSIYAEASEATPEDRKKLGKIAHQLESNAKIKNMLELTKKFLAVSITEFDLDPWLLNVQNGTIDLRTSELLPHNRDDLMLKMCPVEYDPDATSELFEEFLNRIMPVLRVKLYVQEALGYSITGDTSMEKLFFAYGQPATGKTTLLSTIETALGDYSATADFESFVKKDKSAGAPRNDIARLTGKRFVTCSEIAANKKLNTELINRITGGGEINARFLFQEDFQFEPSSKFWWCANNRPRIDSRDNAIWRRLVPIPLDQVIPVEERDSDLKMKLKEELPAVLRWLVDGTKWWYEKKKLTEPEEIIQLADEYKDESDPLVDFIRECCEEGKDYRVKNPEIRDAYCTWYTGTGENERFRLGTKKFKAAMEARGYTAGQTNSYRFFDGIKLKE